MIGSRDAGLQVLRWLPVLIDDGHGQPPAWLILGVAAHVGTKAEGIHLLVGAEVVEPHARCDDLRTPLGRHRERPPRNTPLPDELTAGASGQDRNKQTNRKKEKKVRRVFEVRSASDGTYSIAIQFEDCSKSKSSNSARPVGMLILLERTKALSPFRK
jgi:hypothetical protein